MCIFYPCTKILRTQKFTKQALFTTAKEIIHDINSPLIRYHTDIEYITTFLRHTCVSSSDRHDIFNFSYEPHENVAVIHFLQKITHFAHILQLDRQLYAPKTLHETPLISFCPNFHSLDIASAIMYGRHLEYRISQSLRNLTHSHHTTRATGDESVIISLPTKINHLKIVRRFVVRQKVILISMLMSLPHLRVILSLYNLRVMQT